MLRILCAAKDDRLPELVKLALSGYECQVIKSSSVALALFLANKNFPSLILSEQRLTEGHADELLAALKEDPDLARIPCIIVGSARADQQQGAPPTILPDTAEQMRKWLEPYLIELCDNRPAESSE